MAIFRRCFAFMVAGAFGVYLAQNYDVPNIKKLADHGLSMAKKIEHAYRKQPKSQPQNESGDDGIQSSH